MIFCYLCAPLMLVSLINSHRLMQILIPPNYTKYFAWHYDDHSARLCSVDQDKVCLCSNSSCM